MLPKGDDRLPGLKASLKDFRVFDIAKLFEEHYRDAEFKTQEHAEVALLEIFFQRRLSHYLGIPYIGCSKPSCYCCDLYMNHHPGHYLPRPCHGNVWKKWRPPLLTRESDETLSKHTKDILNAMVKDIRSHLFSVIERKVFSRQRVPDSTTGISDLTQLEIAFTTGALSPSRPSSSVEGSIQGDEPEQLSTNASILDPSVAEELTSLSIQGAEADGDDDGDEEVIVFKGRKSMK